jgi:hypothetical protein
MAKDQMRVHANPSLGILLLSNLLTNNWHCTKYRPVSCKIGQMRDRTDGWSTLWSRDDSSPLHATVLVRYCPQTFHGHTEHSLCHLTD